jgi:proline iminopeptidase
LQRTLFPVVPPVRSHRMPVSDGHELHVEEHGNLAGLPVLILHGGPGSGCSALLPRFFNPERYRIVCVDQRGAGLSTPAGSIDANTTEHLIDDLVRVRRKLGIEQWLVAGGSWGATLAIAYAAAEPAAISGMLLRATFLARPADIEGFFAGAPAELARSWNSIVDLPIAAAMPVARAWRRWEQSLESPSQIFDEPDAAVLRAMVQRYRIQSHYLSHGCWLIEAPLLDRCAAVPGVPTMLLHGTADRVCLPAGAYAVHARLPHSLLRWARDAGHDPNHPAMVELMLAATECFARNRHFETTATQDP